jgi:HEAT repeat protein
MKALLRRAWVCAGLLLLSSAVPAHPAPAASELEQLFDTAAQYRSGQSMQPLRRIEQAIRQSAADSALRKQIELGLIRLLDPASTLEAKEFACQQLAIVGSEASLPGLAGLLRDESTAALACRALSTHPSPKATEILREGLVLLRGPARVQAANILGDRQDSAAVKLLIQLAADTDLATAQAAVLALGKIADPPARDAMVNLRKQPKPELAGAVTEASMNAAEKLATSGDAAAARAIYAELVDASNPANVRRGAFEALLQLDEDAGLQRILTVLRGSDELLKPVAISSMRSLRSESASEEFVRALPELPAQEQIWVLEVLAGRPGTAVRSAIAQSLLSPDAGVRLGAIAAASKSADPSWLPNFVAALGRATNSQERAAVEKALILLPGGPDSDRRIAEQLGQTSGKVKASLMLVLARREAHSAVPGIVEQVGDPELAQTAFAALAALASAEHVPLLLDSLVHLQVPAVRSDAENAVTQALGKIKDPARRADLVCPELSKAPDLEARCSLLRLLPFVADPKALAVLDVARHSSQAQVRDTAIRALTDWPDAQAWESLVAVCKEADTQAHRVLAMNALVRLADDANSNPDARLIERYRLLVQLARTDEDRRLILSALSGAAHPEALALAKSQLANPGVHAEAAVAVERITAALEPKRP